MSAVKISLFQTPDILKLLLNHAHELRLGLLDIACCISSLKVLTIGWQLFLLSWVGEVQPGSGPEDGQLMRSKDF